MRILQKTVQLADPHMCSDSQDRLNLLGALFDALVTRHADGGFAPALASRWRVDDDARCWTFRLRDDVIFHNGERMHAADVKASLQRACDPAVGGELGTEGVWASYLGDAAIRVDDATTVHITTARPMADLLELLVDIPIAPRSALDALPDTFVGSGPYRLYQHEREQVVLTAFPQSVVRTAREKALEWHAAPQEKERLAALLDSRADLICMSSRVNADAASAAGMKLLTHRSNLCVAFLFNAASGPGSDRRLRQAVNLAVNVPRMIDQALQGAGTPLNGPLSPLHFGCDTSVPPYPHDPSRARALLADSGAGHKLVVDVPTSLPDEAPLLGKLLAEDLRAVGLETEVRRHEDRTAYAHAVKAKAINDLCCFDSSPLSTFRVLREKLDSSVAGPWWQGYHNPAVNELLHLASRSPDNARRRALYHEAYRAIHQDAPWLFLYRPTRFWAAGPGTGIPAAGPDGLLQMSTLTVSH